MATRPSPCPTIEVLYWDASNVHVECPYCEEMHRHGVALPGIRISHCHPGGHYEFKFPIDEASGLVGYEIDKRGILFVNIHLDACQRERIKRLSDTFDGELVNQFDSAMRISVPESRPDPELHLYNDSTETITIHFPDGDTFEQARIVCAVSECVTGDLPAISQYLDTSPEAKLFLHGKDETGNTTLIMASAEESHEMVSLLLQHGADANAINDDGRSALMEAALWGRIDNVKALLSFNADKHLRDHHGRCAMDLAQPDSNNQKERYRHSRLAAQESVPERDRDRRHIMILLDDSNAERRPAYTAPLSKSDLNNYSFMKIPS